jgi:hypothetical protein
MMRPSNDLVAVYLCREAVDFRKAGILLAAGAAFFSIGPVAAAESGARVSSVVETVMASLRVEKRESLQVLAGPQRHAGPVVHCIHRNDGVRVVEIDRRRRAARR